MIKLQLPAGKKVYFASDFHLGAPNKEESLVREKRIVRWLDEIAADAHHVFLVGDIFDFWFEYREVIPRGFLRFQGKLAQLVDQGIGITLFTGNHDMWMFGYFTEELGIPVYRRPQELKINGLSIHIAHGDGLGPGDHTYKFLKVLFESKTLRWLFARLHPNFSLWFGHTWSVSKKKREGFVDTPYTSPEIEYLWHYCNEQEAVEHRDYYIFGHRHLPLRLPIGEQGAWYYNLGEWFSSNTYAICDGATLELKAFEKELWVANEQS